MKEPEDEPFVTKVAKINRAQFYLVIILLLLFTFITVFTVGFAFVLIHQTYYAESQASNFRYDVLLSQLPSAMPLGLSRQSRALKLEKSAKCLKVNCLAGFDFNEETIQDEIDLDIGRKLIELEPEDETEEKIGLAFLKCMSNMEDKESSKRTFLDVYNKIMDIEVFVDKLSNEPKISLSTGLTRIALIYWKDLGINVLFNHKTFWNFDRNDTNRRLTVYLKQNTPPKLDLKLLRLVAKGAQFTNRRTGAADVFQFFNHSANSKLLQTSYSADPLSWISITTEEANVRWPFFDFTEYFHQLGYPINNYADEVEMKFVVESVAYLDALKEYLQTAKQPAAYAFLHYLGFYTTLYEYQHHFMVDQFESGGKRTVNLDTSLRRCGAEVRRFLPVAVSNIYSKDLELSDVELMITESTSVYNYSNYEEDYRTYEVKRDFTKLFTNKNYHNRLQYDKLNGTTVDLVVQLRHFHGLRNILALIHSNLDEYVNNYAYKSALTVLPEFVAQERTMYIPLGIMNLLQHIYDDHSHALDEDTRFEKMLSTLKCLIRTEKRKEQYFWDNGNSRSTRGMLKSPQALRKIKTNNLKNNC
ncbi:unnamed protein product [Bursaphelenchus okinawaensis]|uniref:Peptidase_M13_N domain-containing protein n=1 Tax=Bursaphelenchus okinawaensis TaxID=465554 RepID=A0A811K5K0_9BILA|nr:unnamed protein product [Bursaphelenchus okinawaensis]CAG9091783.1 unnamed protein product [Bursaphelenchus okinawaensis]